MLLFWICSALLTVGVVVALTRPLLSDQQRSDLAHGADHSDLDVYRAQLTEIETDQQRGLIAGVEAEAARVEVARRLLARAAELEAGTPTVSKAAPTGLDQRLFYIVAAAVPALALLLYLNLGQPGLPGQPIAQRLARSAPGSGSVEEMIAQVEARLRANPGEGQGWEVLAPVYLRLDRVAEAADAYQRAIEILGPSPQRLGGFAEATIMANNGVVTEPARRAYSKLLELEPGRPEARFGLALAKQQDGDLAAAEADYRALLAETPPDAPWREYITAQLEAIAERLGGDKPSRPPANPIARATGTGPAPSPDAALAVAALPPAERMAQITQMVEGLEARLKGDGRDVEGWQRVLRSWSVLGRKDRAVAALRDARKALAGDTAGLGTINAFAKTLGLES